MEERHTSFVTQVTNLANPGDGRRLGTIASGRDLDQRSVRWPTRLTPCDDPRYSIEVQPCQWTQERFRTDESYLDIRFSKSVNTPKIVRRLHGHAYQTFLGISRGNVPDRLPFEQAIWPLVSTWNTC